MANRSDPPDVKVRSIANSVNLLLNDDNNNNSYIALYPVNSLRARDAVNVALNYLNLSDEPIEYRIQNLYCL